MPVRMVFRSEIQFSSGEETSENTMDKIQDLGVEVRIAKCEEEAVLAVQGADAFYGNLTPTILSAGSDLRWVQATSAGLDDFFFPELRASSVTVTNLRGIYSDVIADHVFSFVLSFARGMHIYGRRQMVGEWLKGADVIHLAGTTLGVVGLGGIGLEVAKRGEVFGMRVLAVDPAPKGRPNYVEEIWGSEKLKDMLRLADFVVICVPHTDETAFMIDLDAMKEMKSTAILINIGRGKVVDLKALTHSLQTGELGGAGLDVFQEEPLSEGDPLWKMEKVMITPHVAGVSPHIENRRKELILENIRRFCTGESLLNIVDKEKGYVVEQTL